MLSEEVLNPIITDIDTNNKTISVAIDTIIKRDGVVISMSRHRCAFEPGQIEEYKQYVKQTDSPEITYLSAIWTPDVIKNHKESVKIEQ